MIKLNLSKLICNLKNATLKNLKFTIVNYSLLNVLILQYFLNYKLIKGFLVLNSQKKNYYNFIEINSLNYIKNLSLYSKSCLPKYLNLINLIKVSKNYYFGLVSTSKGILSINESISNRLGGELLVVIK